MNLNDVRGKLDVLAANQKQLEWLRSLPQADFLADVRNLDSTLHRLQTSIQALLDIAAYVVGSLKLGTPQHTADIIFALRDASLLDSTAADNYATMIAFRNRVVHLYNRIDPGIVYEILNKHISDLQDFHKTLVEVILRHPDPSTTKGPA